MYSTGNPTQCSAVTEMGCCCCCLVAQLCLTLCNPMDCCMAGLPVHHQFLEFQLMSIESVMPSNHLILCWPLLLPPSIFPSIRVFSNESVLHLKWPKYWSFTFSISPYSEYSGLISFRIDWLDLLADQTIYNYNEAKFIFANNFTISDQKVVRIDDRKIY